MSDVRFSCCFCAQHIACDPGYIATSIDCPACGRRIIVPQPAGLPNAIAPKPAVALPGPRSAASLDLWTEEAWAEHVRQNPGLYTTETRWNLPPLSILLSILLAAALPCMVALGATVPMMWVAIALGALVSGGLMFRDAALRKYSVLAQVACFFIGMLFYAFFAEIFLLGGCCWPGRVGF